MKRSLLYILVLLTCHVSAQQPLSPEAFLGYEPGTQYTPHYRITAYCQALAQAHPEKVRTLLYGKTYEGRDLLLVLVSSPANMQRLEAIQANNQRLSEGTGTAVAVTANAPAIVWLSYNVHGNEPSSSEAALQTLYTLATDTSANIREWLQKVVVIVDPCLNPDGRERYINWYNSMKGAAPNPDVQSREHVEPWPGGRSNHYNFDLNRDWAWQTQAETQQRMAVFSQWLPQVHVDFHEQSINSPYYFAPGAEPMHEVITGWQKTFQQLAGRNNAQYFDNKGWLYFTKQEFDLFYPSYGDTYPMFNGSIGMTYEQAGNAQGGLAAITTYGDTLTLAARVQHHYTTGLATIETAAINATKLVTEYKQYFDNNRSGRDYRYKTFVVTADAAEKLQPLKKLLDLNHIEYGSISGKVSGFNYTTGKEAREASLGAFNLAIPSAQARGSLVKVLFDPANKLNDSVTYDITAWALPYAYGLQGYALKEARTLQPFKTDTTATNATSHYGYIAEYKSIKGIYFLAALLKQKIRVRYAEKAFAYNNKTYKAGTFILLKAGNTPQMEEHIRQAAAQFHLQLIPVNSGFMDSGADFGSPDVKTIRQPRVALVTGKQVSATAAGEVWHLFDQALRFPLTLLNEEDLARSNLSAYTTIIFPDGEYEVFNEKTTNEKLKNFVRTGGKIIAMENTLGAMAGADWNIQLKDEQPADSTGSYDNLKIYADRNKDYVSKSISGAIYKTDMDTTHPLAFGYDQYFTLKMTDKVFHYLKDGWNVGYIKKDNYRLGFAGNKLKKQIADGLVLGEQPMGKGSVIYIADDPLFRLFWKSGEQLFCNAVFLTGSE